MKYEIGETVFFPLTKQEVEVLAYSDAKDGRYYKVRFSRGDESWWEETYFTKIKN